MAIIIHTKGPDFVLPFGRYKGQSLDKISDTNPGYICWLHDHAVFAISPEFLDDCRRDKNEEDNWADYYPDAEDYYLMNQEGPE